MARVKICGTTSVEDALLAVEAGADALGFIFCDSPRRVDAKKAAEISSALPPLVSRVGVVAATDAGSVKELADACRFDTVQLVGYPDVPDIDELRSMGLRVILALRIKDAASLSAIDELSADAYLLDTYRPGVLGGTGERFDWELAALATRKTERPVIVAGGLAPENVAELISKVSPYAVDVCSGVEASPGKKDAEKLRRFIHVASGRQWPGADRTDQSPSE